VRSIRNARAEYGVEPARKIGAVVVASDAAMRGAMQEEVAVLALLAKLEASQVCFACWARALFACGCAVLVLCRLCFWFACLVRCLVILRTSLLSTPTPIPPHHTTPLTTPLPPHHTTHDTTATTPPPPP